MQEKHLKKFSVEIETIKETDKFEIIYGGNPIEIDQQDLIDLVYRKIGKYENFTLTKLAKNRVKIRRKIRKKIKILEKTRDSLLNYDEYGELYYHDNDWYFRLIGKIKGLEMCLKLLDKQKDW